MIFGKQKMDASMLYREKIILLFEGSQKAIPFNAMVAILLALDFIHNKVPVLLTICWLISIIILSISRAYFCKKSY